MPGRKTKRICPNGHTYFKSSDCPVCPVCESIRRPESEFLQNLSTPARRALEMRGIKTLKNLSGWSETEILSLHGIGKSSIPILRKELKAVKLSFKD